MFYKLSLMLAIVAVTLHWPIQAVAEQSVTFDEFTIHYNALTTERLQPGIARAYGITRSKSRVLLNVSVLKKVMGTTGEPVAAAVTARATNLNNQLKSIEMRRAGDKGGGIYYLGEVSVDNGELLHFHIEVTPEGTDEIRVIEFQQQFFTS
ncbi:MAG: DUF4426 domain-containing protein [Gammaproteobacteria bacterium]|nr:DUF4426 domain-containing protein [Gammaproteobacteria bacterium]